MQQTIVVPLDGSDLAERALPYAVRLAQQSRARLVLLRAVLAHPAAGVSPVEARAAVVERAQFELGTVAERLRFWKAGLAVEPAVVYSEAAAAITETVRERQASLIVMATLGHTGPGRWLYGSVADRVLRRAEVPVLLIPATCEQSWPSGRTLRILVPLDGSAYAEEVLGPAAELAALHASELVLVRVAPRERAGDPHGLTYMSLVHDEAHLAEAQRYLEQVAAHLRAGGRTVSVMVLRGDPASAISELARQQRVHLIALANHGRGGLARLVMGSTATGVLARAHTPLLLVRPTHVQEAGGSAPVAAEPSRPTLAIAVTQVELDLLRAGLEALLREAELEAGARVRGAAGAQAVADLLARLHQAEPVDVGKYG
jgi:nucleotide-binding universal stress UspA family protein